eukprot:scaffold449_cov241-Pinguiococcus_pyrenoidosus.AAC.27
MRDGDSLPGWTRPGGKAPRIEETVRAVQTVLLLPAELLPCLATGSLRSRRQRLWRGMGHGRHLCCATSLRHSPEGPSSAWQSTSLIPWPIVTSAVAGRDHLESSASCGPKASRLSLTRSILGCRAFPPSVRSRRRRHSARFRCLTTIAALTWPRPAGPAATFMAASQCSIEACSDDAPEQWTAYSRFRDSHGCSRRCARKSAASAKLPRAAWQPLPKSSTTPVASRASEPPAPRRNP